MTRHTPIHLTTGLIGKSLSMTTKRGNNLVVRIIKVESHTPAVAFDRTPTGVKLKVEVTHHEVGTFTKGKGYSLFFLKPSQHAPNPLMIHMSDDVSMEAGPEYWALLFAETDWVLQINSIEVV